MVRRFGGLFWVTLVVGCDVFHTADPAECIEEVLFDGLDNDCDGRPDESRFESRVHCGRAHRPCILPPGAGDVACIDGQCVPVEPDSVSFERADQCTNGIDDDGNGTKDDGPNCEVLIANVARPDCHGRTGERDCPPTVVHIGRDSASVRNNEGPRQPVAFTRDFLVDRYEISRGQWQQQLIQKGKCGESAHRGCEVPPEALDLPASAVSWCEAIDYCRWAGKRLLSEAQWERMAAGTEPTSGFEYPFSGGYLGPPNDDTGIGRPDPSCLEAGCSAECKSYAPLVVDCFPQEDAVFRPVGHVGGWRAIGDRVGDGPSTVILNVAGGIWEWVQNPFERYPPAPDGTARAGADLANLVNPGLRGLRGGGLYNPLDSAATANRLFAPPLAQVESYGIRCGRDFLGAHAPKPELTPPSSTYADCSPPVEGCGGLVEGSSILRAVAACSPELLVEDEGNAAFRTTINAFLGNELTVSKQLVLVINADEVKLGLSTLVDDRSCWLTDSNPTVAAGACPSGMCNLDGFEPARLVIPRIAQQQGLILFADVAHLEEVPVGPAVCGAVPLGGDRHFLIHLFMDAESPFIWNSIPLGRALCQDLDLLCTTPGVTPENCPTTCRFWSATFEVLMRPDGP